MSTRTAKPRGVKPRKTVDWNIVDNLLMAGCTGTEVAANFDMHPVTFYEKCQQENGIPFTEYRQLKLTKGDAHIRATQYKKAISGDNTQLIWLGKNRLGQRENPELANKFSDAELAKFDQYLDMLAKAQSSVANNASNSINKDKKS